MINNNINEQLLELYSKNWDSYLKWKADVREKKLNYTRPLLLKLQNEEAYSNADIKVMILGQETNGWAEGTLITNPLATMESYVKFFNDGNKVKWRGPFWNETKRLISTVKSRYHPKRVAYTYNNVVKIGKASGAGFPGGLVYKMEMDCFNVLREEIEILKPDLLVFFSGPTYDERVLHKLGSFTEVGMPKATTKQFCQMQFAGDSNLPLAFRTYHPRGMYQNKLPKEQYYKQMIDILADKMA